MFEIYFQSGEFIGESSNFWVSVCKDFLLPALGVGVPLYIFYVGINNQRKDDVNKVRISNAERLKYLTIKISNILEFTALLKQGLDQSLSQAQSQIRSVPRIYLPASNEIVRVVENLDHESLLRAYTSLVSSDYSKLNELLDTLDEINLIKARFEKILIEFSQLLEPFEAEFRTVFNDIVSEIQLLELSNSAPSTIFTELRDVLNTYFSSQMKAIENKVDIDFEMIFVDQIIKLTAGYVGQGRSKFERILLLARDFHPKLVGYNLKSVRLQHELMGMQLAVMKAKVDLMHNSIELRNAEKSGKFDEIIKNKLRQKL